jgi:tRNA A37 threonylcarbamoyladenosine dehydratase
MNVETEGGQVRDPSWSARLEGLIPRVISEKRVAVIGCGSVGSFIADELARAGVSKFILIDPDVVEWPNLTRAVYGFSDIGNYKVDALSKQLKSIFPDISVLSHSRELQDLSGNLVELLNSVARSILLCYWHAYNFRRNL